MDTFVRKSDKDGSEGLLIGLDIAIERMSQKTPSSVDAIPDVAQDIDRSTFNEGGTWGKRSKKHIIGKTLNLPEHKKTPYSLNRWFSVQKISGLLSPKNP